MGEKWCAACVHCCDRCGAVWAGRVPAALTSVPADAWTSQHGTLSTIPAHPPLPAGRLHAAWHLTAPGLAPHCCWHRPGQGLREGGGGLSGVQGVRVQAVGDKHAPLADTSTVPHPATHALRPPSHPHTQPTLTCSSACMAAIVVLRVLQSPVPSPPPPPAARRPWQQWWSSGCLAPPRAAPPATQVEGGVSGGVLGGFRVYHGVC